MARSFAQAKITLSLFMFFLGMLSQRDAAAAAQPCPDIDTRIPVRITDEQFVEATLKLPGCLKSGRKVPVFLIFGGFESAGRVLELIHPTGPLALASFDYPFKASRKLELRDGVEILKEGKALYPETVRGIISLTSALKAMPQIDSKRIFAIGASFGSPFVLGAAARDSDIAGIAIVHGFGRVPETAEHVILRSWLPKYGWTARPLAWLASRAGWFLLNIETPESEALKLRPTQQVLMVTAKDDSFIPQGSSDSLWAAIQSSPAVKTRVVMPGDHLMPGSDGLINKIVREVEAWAFQL